MKKLIAVLMVLVIAVSAGIAPVYADDTALYNKGLLAFATGLAAYGVHMVNSTKEDIRTLYDSYVNSLDAEGLAQFYIDAVVANRQTLINGAVDALSLGLDLNSWIKSKFGYGYGNVAIYNEEFVEGGSIAVGQSKQYSLLDSNCNVGAKYSFRCNGIYISLEVITKGVSYATCHYNVNGVTTGVYPQTGDICYWWYANTNFEDIIVKFSRYSNSVTVDISGPGSGGSTTRSSMLRMTVTDGTALNINPSLLADVRYYAGDVAVDGVADDYPDKKREVGFPVPDLFNFPNVRDLPDDAGIVYDGSVDDFLDDVAENPDYVGDIVDAIAGDIATPIPVIDAPGGTITWPDNPI